MGFLKFAMEMLFARFASVEEVTAGSIESQSRAFDLPTVPAKPDPDAGETFLADDDPMELSGDGSYDSLDGAVDGLEVADAAASAAEARADAAFASASAADAALAESETLSAFAETASESEDGAVDGAVDGDVDGPPPTLESS